LPPICAIDARSQKPIKTSLIIYIMPTKTNKSATAAAASRSTEAESALKELFVDELKDIYWAEKHLASALPKLIKGATSADLKQTITTHWEETKNQITRLESVFASVGEKAVAKKCLAMEGLLAEATELLEDTEKGTELLDVAIISAAQKVEHYEIASYGTLRTLAGTLGFSEAQGLLDETLAEEKNADSLLTQVAENYVNEAAAAEVA
jgi:ferritin-like metal-binding protein YciE